MTYKEISLGSRDAGPDGEVKKVQQLLNSTGKFNLEEDGIYGTKTDNAVRTFQRANDLTADGIVGQQTWSKLLESDTSHPVLGSQTAESSAANTATSPVIASQSADWRGNLSDTAAVSTPEDYVARMESIYDAWSDREPFSYDVQSDPLYQQYKDIYTHQGRLAMLDTMGQAAALTGGYGSTYAQTAGQQEFQNYMQQLSAAVPELYGAAYDRYNAQGDRLLQEYSLAKDMADSAYAKQTDNYNKLATLLPLGYSPTDDELTAAGMTRPQANTISDYYKSQNAQSTGSTGSYAPSYDNKGFDSSIIRKAQQAVGASVDGQWGTQSQNKAKAAGYDSLAEVLAAMFTGTTYEDAANFLKQMGAGDEIGNASSGTGLMSKKIWDIWKKHWNEKTNKNVDVFIPEIIRYAVQGTYQEYLENYITSALER